MTRSRYYDFFGVTCQIWHVGDGNWWACSPWRFRIWLLDGAVVEFVGVPNYCDTFRQALMRAWHRCKWIADGSYNQRYR